MAHYQRVYTTIMGTWEYVSDILWEIATGMA